MVIFNHALGQVLVDNHPRLSAMALVNYSWFPVDNYLLRRAECDGYH